MTVLGMRAWCNVALVMCTLWMLAACGSPVQTQANAQANHHPNAPPSSSHERAASKATASAVAVPEVAKSGPSGFALNSSVIVGITPLVLTHMYARSGLAASSMAERDLPSGSNLTLRVSPWAVVQVDGKRLGTTPPMVHLSLPVGSRTVELSNPGFETVKRVIQVVNGKTVTITHDFESR